MVKSRCSALLRLRPRPPLLLRLPLPLLKLLLNPRSLRRLYLATKTDLEDGVAAFLERAYERMLENEQLSVGWEDPMFSFVQSARAGGI